MGLTHQQVRAALDFIAEDAGEYAGLPMALDGESLVIHKSYRYADVVMKKTEEEDGVEIINSWWSRRVRARIYLWRENGGIDFGYDPVVNSAVMQMRTMGVSVAWTIEAEAKAQQKLATLLPHHAFRAYLLTGSFLETSKRSRITYLFRRLRPTVAIAASVEPVRLLCALCLHPIGYYEESWAGCMVPTDEVIAHLMLMRGDEHDYWKQANQHPVWYPQAGL